MVRKHFIFLALAVMTVTSVLAVSIASGQSISADGDIETNAQLVSNVATGTAPLEVSSTTVVPNLNADKVDGVEGAALALNVDLQSAEAMIASLQAELTGLTRCLAKSGQRYWDLGDGTVLDCNTGLIWLKNASCVELGAGPASGGLADWNTAHFTVASLADGMCGLTDGSLAGDWRQPEADEFCSVFDFSDLLPCPESSASNSLIDSSVSGVGVPKVVNATGDTAWSEGDLFVGVEPAFYWTADWVDIDSAYLADLSTGEVRSFFRAQNAYVWAVRGGNGSVAPPPPF